MGFAIAKKKVALATGRNRIRRVARESFRLNRDDLPAVDLVVMAQPGAKEAGNQDLFRSLERHWSRIRAKHARQTADAKR